MALKIPKWAQNRLVHDAVYWEPTGADKRGRMIFGAPTQIKCRWQDAMVLFSGSNGEQMLSTAKVFPDRELKLDGYLMRGTLADVDSDQKPGYGVDAYPIRALETHPSLDGKQEYHVVWLQKKVVSGKVKGGG